MGDRSNKLSNRIVVRIGVVVLVLVFLAPVIASFPVVHFNDSAIRMFAPDRLGSGGRGFQGRVFGNHVLETEYGEIRLRHFASITARAGTVVIIPARSFERGRASHNLVVEGMVIPQNIEIIFYPYTEQLRTLILHRGEDWPEIIVSGIPLSSNRIDFNPLVEWVGTGGGVTAEIIMIFLASGYVTLADTTQIYFPLGPLRGLPVLRTLHIDKEDDRWRIFTRTGRRTTVRRPGETEFVEYREITFSPHWGEFIGGVPVE